MRFRPCFAYLHSVALFVGSAAHDTLRDSVPAASPRRSGQPRTYFSATTLASSQSSPTPNGVPAASARERYTMGQRPIVSPTEYPQGTGALWSTAYAFDVASAAYSSRRADTKAAQSGRWKAPAASYIAESAIEGP